VTGSCTSPTTCRPMPEQQVVVAVDGPPREFSNWKHRPLHQPLLHRLRTTVTREGAWERNVLKGTDTDRDRSERKETIDARRRHENTQKRTQKQDHSRA